MWVLPTAVSKLIILEPYAVYFVGSSDFYFNYSFYTLELLAKV